MVDHTGSCNCLRYAVKECVPYDLHDGDKLQGRNCPRVEVPSKVLDNRWNEVSPPYCDISSRWKLGVFGIDTSLCRNLSN